VKTLTVTAAAKNLAACLRQVYHQHESFELVKNGVPYAHLVPINGTSCNTHELAVDLTAVKLSLEDRRALASAVRKGRKLVKPLKNPWR
jgi:antitoxin (DNA-binding transcriptional repressor) of toxin-antitoxin stability system